MTILEVIVMAVGLALDTMIVTIQKGAIHKNIKKEKLLEIGFIYGAVQTVVMGIGYFIMLVFTSFIDIGNFSRMRNYVLVSAVIFILCGIYLFYNTDRKRKTKEDTGLYLMSVFVSAFKGSIDAFFLGIASFVLYADILLVLISVFLITMVMAALGLLIGYYYGERYLKFTGVSGGVLMILMGIYVIMKYRIL
jgi:putative Mn2+ efflux pump MntP